VAVRTAGTSGPPGLNRPDGPRGAACVQAWLAYEKEGKPESPWDQAR